MNVLNGQSLAELDAGIARAVADEAVKGVVLTSGKQGIFVADIPVCHLKIDIGQPPHTTQRFGRAVGEIVENKCFVTFLENLEQRVAADVTSTTSDQYAHTQGPFVSSRRLVRFNG